MIDIQEWGTCMIKQESFRAMNTNVTVYLESTADPRNSEDDEELNTIVSLIQLLFNTVERICSRFIPTSELQQLNRSPEQLVTVSPILFDVLQQAHNAYKMTNGIFNPGISRNLQSLGYNRSFELIEREDLQSRHKQSDIRPILKFPYELDEKKRTVWLHHGMEIDLGGIAKGWTVDRATRDLRHYGRGFVNAGGDIRFFGIREDSWRIGIENPFDCSKDIATLSIQSGGVATSSTMKRKWKRENQMLNHLIDPSTGYSTTSDIVSTTVVAQTATEADVWAKTLLLVGPEQAMQYIQKYQLDVTFVDTNEVVRRVAHAMV
jgi:FAD:protein FMN transferase